MEFILTTFLTHKVMEQHEIAIRGEVAEEIEVIMGDMASEIKVWMARGYRNLVYI